MPGNNHIEHSSKASGNELNAIAHSFTNFIEQKATYKTSNSQQQCLCFTDVEKRQPKILPPLEVGPYFDNYLRYIVCAGNAFVNGAIETEYDTPKFFECVLEGAIPFCCQFGPFYCEEPFKACGARTLANIGEVLGSAIQKRITSPASHNIYYGYCGPRTGPGTVTIFAWVPTFQISRADNLSLRREVVTVLTDRSKMGKTVFTYDNKPIVATVGSNTGSLTDSIIAHIFARGGVAAGCNGIVPMPWCRDPNRSDSAGASNPIVPIVSYSVLRGEENGAILDFTITFEPTFDECLGVQGSSVLKGISLPPRYDLSNTPADNSRYSSNNRLIETIGCRACGNTTITVYDTFPFIVSSGYMPKVASIVSAELPNNIFNNCAVETKNIYVVPEMLKLLSVDRFNTTTTSGIALCSELLQALISEHNEESSRPEHALQVSLGIIQDVAKTLGATNFDAQALARHHAQNYEKGRQRSRRLIANYARIDSPLRFSDLLASRIWEKLLVVQDPDHTVLIAEALATYVVTNHHMVPDPIKTNTALYIFKSSAYSKIEDPANYLSGLLSPDGTCGHLYVLLVKFVSRVNSILASSVPGDNTSNTAIADNVAMTTGYLNKTVSAINSVLSKLKESGYKNGLVRELMTKIHQEQFAYMHVSNRAMDDDIYLTGVKNGVLEVVRSGHSREIFFRQGTPDDMITQKLNATYNPSVKGTKKWSFIQNYFNMLQECPRTRLWYTCQLAEIFVSTNNKIGTFVVGSTDAGKSDHISHLKNFLGPGMGESIGSNVLNDAKVGTDTPQPGLARAAKSRLGFFEETSAVLKNNMFKVLTGGSAETAIRTLHKEGASMVFRAKVFFAMNQFPKFELYEESIFTRLAIFEISCKFLDPSNPNLPKTEAERMAKRIFPKDPSFSARMKDAHDALLMYLMEHFDKWTDEKGVKTSLNSFTPKMQRSADRVRAQCPYANFVSLYMSKAGNDTSTVVNDAYTLFVKKCSRSHVVKETFSTGISAVIGINPIDGRWYGWSLQDPTKAQSDGGDVQVPTVTEEELEANAYCPNEDWDDSPQYVSQIDISRYFEPDDAEEDEETESDSDENDGEDVESDAGSVSDLVTPAVPLYRDSMSSPLALLNGKI